LTWYRDLGGCVLSPELRALWRHQFLNENRPVHAALAADPSVGFVVSGADLGRDTAVLGGGGNLYFDDRIGLFANYDLVINAVEVAHAGRVGVQFVW